MGYNKKWYAIREVSQLTGVKPVTLRAWQRRYHLVQPERTAKGHRLYTDEHIMLIGTIQSWLSKGVSIGKVKALLDTNSERMDVLSDNRQQLEEVGNLLDALANLDQFKTASIVNKVLKEYPLHVVDRQFIQPVYTALKLVKYSLRLIQSALLDTVLEVKLNTIIEAENKAAGSRKCLIINCDSYHRVASRLWAMKLSEQGWHIVIIDGVEDFSGLIEHQGLHQYQVVSLFSSAPLNKSQQAVVVKLESKFCGELLQPHCNAGDRKL